jgi:hypothetical protein
MEQPMNIRCQRRREWFRILRDLMGKGVSMSKVAAACGRDVKTVSNWADGGEPKDSDARVVLAMYKKFCPDAYTAHMQQFDPDYLIPRPYVDVKPDNAIRGRPMPRKVRVYRTPDGLQNDLFTGVL